MKIEIECNELYGIQYKISKGYASYSVVKTIDGVWLHNSIIPNVLDGKWVIIEDRTQIKYLDNGGIELWNRIYDKIKTADTFNIKCHEELKFELQIS